jgi:hypothetical protein
MLDGGVDPNASRPRFGFFQNARGTNPHIVDTSKRALGVQKPGASGHSFNAHNGSKEWGGGDQIRLHASIKHPSY